MTKTPKTTAVRRDAATGSSVTRGTRIGKFVVAGSTPDGIVIFEPKPGPKNFTKAQIRRAVHDVKERQRLGEIAAG